MPKNNEFGILFVVNTETWRVESMKDKSFTEKLIALRKRDHLSQVELGRRLNLDRSSMNKLEHGSRNVSAKEIKEIAEIFHVSSDYLLGINDVPEWATLADVANLKSFLQENENPTRLNFDREELTEDEQAKLKEAISLVFWDKLKEKKKK